jgi:deazaflavin-dependent oxidoreductase (nitroreductase family)
MLRCAQQRFVPGSQPRAARCGDERKVMVMTARAYVRPPWAARVIGGRMARLFKPPVVCLLSVPGRTSGEWRSNPVVVLEHDGERYLVGAYGHTEWSRNMRAARRGRLTKQGRTEDFAAVEVPVEQVPPMLDAYLEQFGKLPTVGRTFRALPKPGDHPTFRITSIANNARNA